MPLFSRAVLEAKPITVMYTDAKVEGQSIKLILDSDQLDHRVDQAANAKIITADRATKTSIGKIDNFPFEVNGIVTPIKVLVMEATQYQALVGTPANISRLTHMCTGHKLLIELEEKKEKPIWEAYQGKQKEELIWETDDLTWTDNEQKKPSSWEWKEEKGKGKERKEKNTQANNTYIPYQSIADPN
ncbi:hypothetical protein G9A89_022119 [Geosiphon pyriformis]|nr:hypothetical protein G9A89_022119 [Geosiphon pyriformis]